MKQQKKIHYLFTLLVMLLFSIDCYSQQAVSPELKQTVIKNGIGLGSVLAIVISWSRNKSILFAILHGIISWFYVIYFAIIRNSEEK